MQTSDYHRLCHYIVIDDDFIAVAYNVHSRPIIGLVLVITLCGLDQSHGVFRKGNRFVCHSEPKDEETNFKFVFLWNFLFPLFELNAKYI